MRKVFSMIATSLPKDVILVTEDAKRLEAHSIILKAASTTFNSILHKTNNRGSSADSNTVIYLPGFAHEQLTLVVELIYLGKTKVATHLIQDFKAAVKSLGLFSGFKLEDNIAKQTSARLHVSDKKSKRESDKTDCIVDKSESLETEDGEIIEECVNKNDVKELFDNHAIENQFERCDVETDSSKIIKKDVPLPSRQIIGDKGSNDLDAFDATKEYISEVVHDGGKDFKPETQFKCDPSDPGASTEETSVGIIIDDMESQNRVTEPLAETKTAEGESEKIEDNHPIAGNTPDIAIQEKSRQQKIKRIKKKGKHAKERSKSKDTSKQKTCEFCGKQFKGTGFRYKGTKYYEHMARHKVMDQDCGCGIEFSSFIKKRWHLRVVHEGYFPCNLCQQPSNSVFATEALLGSHKKDKHPENKEQEFKCTVPECNKTFKNRSSIPYHMMSSHDDGGPFCCSHCGKELPSRLTLNAHEKRSHNEQSCPVCFKLVKNLRTHTLDVHTEDSRLRLQCDSCGKGFHEISKLRKHEMNVHIKTRPFKCRYLCENDIGYNDVSNRNSHERKKHGGLFNDGK